jgi:hypothetical protein
LVTDYRNTYGWLSDGRVMSSGNVLNRRFRPYGQGDILGWGMNILDRTIFLTKNGEFLGNFNCLLFCLFLSVH